jgi:hypothetical protein
MTKMMLLVSALWAAVAFAPTEALAEGVRGYICRDGACVAPYNRSPRDGNPYNNHSYPGNTCAMLADPQAAGPLVVRQDDSRRGVIALQTPVWIPRGNLPGVRMAS